MIHTRISRRVWEKEKANIIYNNYDAFFLSNYTFVVKSVHDSG